ncbi:unnamed protein product [Trypanosoma congolense IL3000]|uniref:WGS project CAEQ00000000 data, annotated contig 2072 n=1 Tax=Trypanosoma congolense (strain IL3000) TaxID=1068625 RepID=F9WB81_TRYCI|nr:unnamed protein product [Trypanosoma congolense IL3000]
MTVKTPATPAPKTITLRGATAARHIGRRLKTVSNCVWKRLVEYEQKFDDVNKVRDIVLNKVFIQGGHNLNCGKESSLLPYTQEHLVALQQTMEQNREASIMASGSAGISACGLDEFMSVSKQNTRETGDRNFPATCYKGNDNNDTKDATDTQYGDGVEGLGKCVDAQFSLRNTQGGRIGNNCTLANMKNDGGYVDKKPFTTISSGEWNFWIQRW